ncbi:MAG: hypothetical protein [Microviridae sp.]|nr:MAG: hypothetical protein [Microviridae sp.]
MKTYDMIYVSVDGILCNFTYRESSQSAAIQHARSILSPGDRLLYVCPHSCKMFDDKYMPNMVSLDKYSVKQITD